jgi:hypothetical protein
MLEPRTNDLIHAWVDGCLDDAGFAELEATLAASPEARGRFWDEVHLHSDLYEAFKTHLASSADKVSAAEGAASLAVQQGSSFVERLGRRLWRHGAAMVVAAALVAGGCGLGSVITSLSLAYAGWSPAWSECVVILEEGFETGPAPRHDFVPTLPGYWSGDVTAVVGPEQGVRPKSGRQMLRFVQTVPANQSPASSSASEIWRLVDLEAVRGKLGMKGPGVDLFLELTATFNGVTPASGRDPKCTLKAVATDLSPPFTQALWLQSGLEGARQSDPGGIFVLSEQQEPLDADPGSWQRLTITLRAPARARWLLLYCLASDTSHAARESEPRLEGQYADEIHLSARPLPAVR